MEYTSLFVKSVRRLIQNYLPRLPKWNVAKTKKSQQLTYIYVRNGFAKDVCFCFENIDHYVVHLPVDSY